MAEHRTVPGPNSIRLAPVFRRVFPPARRRHPVRRNVKATGPILLDAARLPDVLARLAAPDTGDPEFTITRFVRRNFRACQRRGLRGRHGHAIVLLGGPYSA